MHKFLPLLLLSSLVSGGTILRNDLKLIEVQAESLDPLGNYLLSWVVDFSEQNITFEIEVVTKGYVGLGISPSGSMVNADLFIGGVYDNGTKYGFDMHGLAQNGMPALDDHQDWVLIDAREDATKTYIKVSRQLNTCDDQDYPISNDTVRIVWSTGTTDDIAYHGGPDTGRRGTQSLNLMMPAEESFDPEQYIKWDLNSTITMPKGDTTYWCSVHKGPTLNDTHHVVAFEALLDNDLAMDHTHHFIVYKCTPPENQTADETFAEFVGQTGQSCYDEGDAQKLPVDYCLGHYLFVWAKGGRRMVFPDDVGYPIPDKVGENNYYMLEIHYDNPDLLEGKEFTTGGRILYTENVRPIDAGILTVSHRTHVSLTIPPNQENYVVAGQCGSECTEWGITEADGINVFNSLLHSHLSGQKLKLRHFRGEEELPWFDFDNHYDFNFQQSKPLIDNKVIKAKDHLTIECTYNNRWNNGSIVVGGLSTREEMCMAFLWYFPKLDFDMCGSAYNTQKHFAELGVTNYTASRNEGGGISKYTIISPPELAGPYEESLSKKFSWTNEFTKEFEQRHRYGEQESYCHSNTESLPATPVSFPGELVEYVPEDVCKNQDDGTTTPAGSQSVVGGSSAIVFLFGVVASLFMNL